MAKFQGSGFSFQPLNQLQSILQKNWASDISLEFVPEALKALDTHSQKKMFDKAITAIESVEKEDWKEADIIFDELDIPIKISMSVNDLSEIIDQEC